MAVTPTPALPQTVRNVIVGLTTSEADIIAAGANFSKLTILAAASSDSTARDVTLYLKTAAADLAFGIVSVPITAGTVNSAPTVDILRHAQLPFFEYDAYGNKCMYLATGSTLRAKVSSGTSVQLMVSVADF